MGMSKYAAWANRRGAIASAIRADVAPGPDLLGIAQKGRPRRIGGAFKSEREEVIEKQSSLVLYTRTVALGG